MEFFIIFPNEFKPIGMYKEEDFLQSSFLFEIFNILVIRLLCLFFTNKKPLPKNNDNGLKK